MIRRIAIIPARGGSKRIPGKNIRNFCGQPIISYVLNAAKESKLFDKIHVSTESNQVMAVVESLGFKIDFLRVKELSGDETPIMPVLNYVISEYESKGEYFDEVWMLMACSPLLEAKNLLEASQLFTSSGKNNPIIAVTEFQAPIEWAMKRNADGIMEPVQPGMFATRSQDLEKKYCDAGVFVAYPTEIIKKSSGPGSDLNKLGFIYPKEKAIDIDDEADWKIAEALYQINQQKLK